MRNYKMSPSSNCYCGQTGDITLNMLECAKCTRWCHEACVKCLDLPMLLGDRFYIFICSVCNAGSECLGRIELEWDDVLHLVLYNLTTLEKTKYYHIDDAIIPFLQDNWERFHLFGQVAAEKKNMRAKVVEVLGKFQNKYKCGKECKKCKNIYALRVRSPPSAPSVLPVAARLKKDVIVWEFKVEDRAYHILAVKKSTKNKENHKNGKHKSKLPLPTSVCQNSEEVSKCRGSVPHNDNGTIKTKQPKSKRTTISFNEESACSGLLDSLIPFPPDFKDCNNPFLESSKKSSSKRPIPQNSKCPPAGMKRRRIADNSSDLTLLNGNHEVSDDNTGEPTSLATVTKEDNLQRLKEEDFCIIGKRTSCSGKIHYLFQRST